MSFEPILLSTGITGWTFLQSTYDDQFENFKNDTVLKRENDYFTENIGNISSAEDLVKDRRLLGVALKAFGLEDQIDYKAMIQKVLEEGTTADGNLASKLDDSRGVDFSKAFGFGGGETRTNTDPVAMAAIVADNEAQSFEIAVGEQDETMRIALYALRELQEVILPDDAEEDGPSVKAQWYNIIGQPQLAKMMQVTLNLPESINLIDVDQQVRVYQEAAQRFLGTDDLSSLSSEEDMNKLAITYLARAEVAAVGNAYSSSSAALSLLQA